MTREDMRFLCLMLGFVTVVVQDGAPKHGAERAASFADLIEAFCLSQQSPEAGIDALIESLKQDLRHKGDADMDRPRGELAALYARLAQRSERYARDDILADLALGLLDAEIDYEDRGRRGIS